jgi:nitrate reductase gamma subunit
MWLMLLGYTAFVTFVVAVLVRVIHFANTPVHLRWELYPVPHEGPEKASYGGSYMEQVDWWTKKQHVDHLHELFDMLGEMLLIKALYEHRFRQWLVSFPFHLGLYLLAGLVLSLIAGGILGALDVRVAADGGFLGIFLYWMTMLLAFAGYVLGLVGAVGLLIRRVSEADLRDFTGPLDYLNLVLFIVLFGVCLAMMAVDPGCVGLRAWFQGLVTFQPAVDLPALTVAAIAMASLMVAYIPLTHMSHFVAKYFTWHSVRWNDVALEPGGALDTAIQRQLQYPMSWSAPHIRREGQENPTWLEVATTNPTEEAAR